MDCERAVLQLCLLWEYWAQVSVGQKGGGLGDGGQAGGVNGNDEVRETERTVYFEILRSTIGIAQLDNLEIYQ